MVKDGPRMSKANREKKGKTRWLTPVILPTQEAEIRRITVQSQPGHIVQRDPILKKPFTKKDWWNGLRCRGPEFKPQYCKKKKKSDNEDQT
jgi:hypothetical protein